MISGSFVRRISLGEFKNSGDGLGQAGPVLFFLCKLLPAGGGEAIVARAAIVLGNAPLRGDPAILLHAVQRRVERTFLDSQDVIRNPLDMQGDAVAMHRALGQSFQD